MTRFFASPKDGAVWITGASAGIGREVALQLADQGFTVYASARSKDKLSELEKSFSGSGKIVAMPLDVTDRQACINCVAKIVEQEGALAICLLNAGTFYPVRGKALDYESFDRTIDININGVINGLVPSVEAMKERGQGQVAVVSSVAGYGGLPKSAAYGISKAGLINMCESLLHDLSRLNIKLQVINPGFVDTPLTEKNDFPMPFLMPATEAAKRICDGLKSSQFEITFPKRFAYMLKTLNLLPYPLYFWAIRKMTGG